MLCLWLHHSREAGLMTPLLNMILKYQQALPLPRPGPLLVPSNTQLVDADASFRNPLTKGQHQSTLQSSSCELLTSIPSDGSPYLAAWH